MLLIPSLERCRININDGIFYECIGSNELVTTGVVDDVNDVGFVGNPFTLPIEITILQTKSTEFEVSSSGTDSSYFYLVSQIDNFGEGRRMSLFESSFFLMNWHAATSGSSFMSRISAYSYIFLLLL